MEFSFEDFKKRASDKKLSKWEKVGFPDEYRKGVEKSIFKDIALKTRLEKASSVLDIGCGCSDLVEHIILHANKKNQILYLVDSQEMLKNINPDILKSNVNLIGGKFPEKTVLKKFNKKTFDVIILYSVIQYVFLHQSIYTFIHHCIDLLNPGGRLLIGDIPNFQSRERFLASQNGSTFFSNKDSEKYSVNIKHENLERIDDSVVMSILFRYRGFGCETYLLPQPEGLPFSNRREDVLIVKR